MQWRTLITLIAIFIAYLAVGAVIFRTIEKPAEDERCQRIQAIVKNISEKCEQEHSSLPIEDVNNLTEVTGIAAENGIYIGENLTVTCSTKWDMEGSFFFCGTVLTTIGYGHVAPTTYIGRLFCILYTTVGIPFVANMFSGLGNNFGIILNRLQMKIKSIERGHARTMILTVLILSKFTIFFLLIPATVFVHVEDWSFHDSFYYAFTTLTTVGFGDFVAGSNPSIEYVPTYRVMVYLWIVFGLAFGAIIIRFLKQLWTQTGGPDVRSVSKNKVSSEISNKNSYDGQSGEILNRALSAFGPQVTKSTKNKTGSDEPSNNDFENEQSKQLALVNENAMDMTQVADYLFAIARRQPGGQRSHV